MRCRILISWSASFAKIFQEVHKPRNLKKIQTKVYRSRIHFPTDLFTIDMPFQAEESHRGVGQEMENDSTDGSSNTPFGNKRLLCALSVAKFENRDEVVFSSGTTDHIFNDLKWFSSFRRIDEYLAFQTATNKGLRTLGTGIVKMTVGSDTWTLSDVHYAPRAAANFLSAGKLHSNGVVFDSDENMLMYKASGDAVCKLVMRHVYCLPDARPFGQAYYF
ncbi:hypothetical protein XA68_17876 [Ophiocordyceps unilateralis]|uniref:Retrovirus-related Pol polyprotein from transposon TNT 1-94-like beta-barrel domain-containing protein n=1 Tax=Ophiocordyceps unilateralis TaxID=268505 RepID=A0A2A9PK11_OPHUN|nr:hypothetical protein XA68_17876 [Ophiocordyceps unilateralis]